MWFSLGSIACVAVSIVEFTYSRKEKILPPEPRIGVRGWKPSILIELVYSPEQNLNHPWERTVRVGERVHIDFAGPVDKHMLLILVDSHPKWIEAIPMKSTTISDTIEVLEAIFACIGLPETLVSDNGPQFTSVEFKWYCKDNNIRHLYGTPCHPSSNGLAERGAKQ